MKLVIGNMHTRAVGNDRFKFLEALEDLKGIVSIFLEGLPAMPQLGKERVCIVRIVLLTGS